MLNLIHTFAFKSYKNWLTTRQFNQDGRMQIDDIELLIFQFVTLYLEMRYCHFTVSIATWLKQVKWKYFITFLRMSKNCIRNWLHAIHALSLGAEKLDFSALIIQVVQRNLLLAFFSLCKHAIARKQNSTLQIEYRILNSLGSYTILLLTYDRIGRTSN